MAAKAARPMSGLQKQVLGLFREALRVARTKDPSVQASTPTWNPVPESPQRTLNRTNDSPSSDALACIGARRIGVIPVPRGRSAGW